MFFLNGKEKKIALNLKSMYRFLCYGKTKCISKGFDAFSLEQRNLRPSKCDLLNK